MKTTNFWIGLGIGLLAGGVAALYLISTDEQKAACRNKIGDALTPIKDALAPIKDTIGSLADTLAPVKETLAAAAASSAADAAARNADLRKKAASKS